MFQYDDMANVHVRRLSHTMRGKMHTANKKLSMIRSKSMERFSKKQEMILVTPKPRYSETEPAPADYSGPFIGQAVALVDFTPNPYDREALRLRRGDIIDVIETNPNGTWRGQCHGRVGNFKFLNVQTIPDRNVVRQVSGDSGHQDNTIHSVQQLLSLLNMGQYLSVFILNGYDNLESLYKIDKSKLEYFGVTDPEKQSEFLKTVQVQILN